MTVVSKRTNHSSQLLLHPIVHLLHCLGTLMRDNDDGKKSEDSRKPGLFVCVFVFMRVSMLFYVYFLFCVSLR